MFASLEQEYLQMLVLGKPMDLEAFLQAFCAVHWCLLGPVASGAVYSDASELMLLFSAIHFLILKHPMDEKNVH